MIAAFAVIALVIAFAVYYLNPDRVAVRNYSEFETYQFAQRSGVSFCADPGHVYTAYTASIRRISPDNYTFTATVLHPNPLRQCRSMGIDPCRISRHAWDEIARDDYMCGTGCLQAAQSISIIDLLLVLRDAK